jgi:hypothetical protein
MSVLLTSTVFWITAKLASLTDTALPIEDDRASSSPGTDETTMLANCSSNS